MGSSLEVATLTAVIAGLGTVIFTVDKFLRARADEDFKKGLSSNAERITALEATNKELEHRIDVLEDSLRKAVRHLVDASVSAGRENAAETAKHIRFALNALNGDGAV